MLMCVVTNQNSHPIGCKTPLIEMFVSTISGDRGKDAPAAGSEPAGKRGLLDGFIEGDP